MKDFVSEKGCRLCAFCRRSFRSVGLFYCSVIGDIVSDNNYSFCPKEENKNFYICADCNACDFIRGECQAVESYNEYGNCLISEEFEGCPLNKWSEIKEEK